MSETAVELSSGDSAVGNNGVDDKKTEITDTDSSKSVSATDVVPETVADPKLKSIPHADKSTTKASKEHNSEESKSPAKRKATATEKSSDDIEDSVDSPAKKKSRTESHNSEESESDEDTKSNQNNKAKKDKIVSEDEHDDDDEEEEEDATVEPGLLERPVVLEAGVKREKKKTQRLDITPVMKKVEVVAGEGTKLGDIPGVEFHLARAPSENLKVLHRVLFDRVGSAPVVKKNIRQFCGFGFLEGSADYKKKHDKLSKMTNAQLKFICEVLHIERGGKKDEITNRILNFLLKPHDSGKPVPTSGKKKRRSSSAKKTSSKKSKSDKPKAKKKAKSDVDEHKETGEDSDESDEEHEDDDDDDDNDDDKSAAESASDSDYEMKKKKKETKKKDKKSTPAKKSSKAAEKTPKSDAKKPSKKPAGGSPKKKTPTPKKSKQVTVASDDSSDEDSEPIQKSTAPTDDVLRNIIKKILKTANLEEVTMKTVCKQVYDKFPEFDLTARKDFIKATVKQILK